MSEQRKGEIEALYAYYAPILDLSVKNKFVLRPEVLAAYQELQFTAQTMAAVDVYVKCRWQAEVVEDTFAHVFGVDTWQHVLERNQAFANETRIIIYAVGSLEVLERIGHKGWLLDAFLKRRKAAIECADQQLPESKPEFYKAQGKLYFAVVGDEEERLVDFYVCDLDGPPYPLMYFCAQKPSCEGALSCVQMEYILFLWREGILKT